MHQSKLIVLLKTFSKEEWKLFDKFIQQPYYNTNKTMIAFLHYLRKSAPTFPAKRLKVVKVYKHLFPKEAFQEGKLRQYRSDLVKLIEQFWITQEQQKQQTQQLFTLSNCYKQRSLDHYWEQTIQQITTHLPYSSHTSIDLAHFNSQLAIIQHENIENKGQRDQEPRLQEVFDALEEHFVISILRYYCKALNFQRFNDKDYQIALIQVVLQQIEQQKVQRSPTLQMYFHATKTLLDTANESDFQALKKLLKKYAQKMNQQEAQDLFVLARNYCIRRINNNRQKAYLKEMFELYQVEIEEKIILKNDNLPDSTYKNIVTLALLLNESEWLEKFIFDFSDYVQEAIFYYNLAKLRFQQKSYEEVLELLKQSNYNEILLKLGVKSLQLKTHFELYLQYPEDFEYEDKLEAFLKSFQTFIQRKQTDLPKHYIFYFNLVKLTKILFKFFRKKEFTIAKQKQFLEDLQNYQQVEERKWLTEKATLRNYK